MLFMSSLPMNSCAPICWHCRFNNLP